MCSQRLSVYSSGNHVGRGLGDCGRHGDYNNVHQIQHTRRQNKDEYDENTHEDQKSNGPERNMNAYYCAV